MHQDVRNHGAVGDGVALDTVAFQRAIDQCHAGGGGRVSVPPGRYRLGSVRLRSNIDLHLESGATVLGSTEENDYERLCPTRITPFPRSMQALFYACDEDDVTVSGTGCIQGGGGTPLPGPEYLRTRFRPCIFHFCDCHGVRVRDIAIRDAWYWTVHLLRCEDVRVRGLAISNHRQRLASAGIVPDGSRNVTISDCVIEAGDDCIVVKDSEGGCCENVVVANCILRSSQAALKIGAQTRGEIRNISFTGCVIEDSFMGLAVFMKDGGLIENVSFSNLIIKADNEFPILVDVTPRRRDNPAWGRVHNLHFTDLLITGRGRCYIQGGPEAPIERIGFRNLTWGINGFCDGLRAEKNHGTEHHDHDPAWPDYSAQPWQFVFAHVRDLQMSQVTCYHSVPLPHQDRGMIYLRDVRGAVLSDLRCPPAPAGMQMMELIQSDDVACAPTVAVVPERARAPTEAFEPVARRVALGVQ